MSLKNFWAQINFGSKKMWTKFWVWKKFLVCKKKLKKFWVWKNVGVWNIWALNIFWGPIKLWIKKCLGPNILWVWFYFLTFGTEKNSWKKFGFRRKIWVQKNVCLMKLGPRTFKSTKNMPPKKWGPKSLVKIGPLTLTADILVIWTNVTRTFVDWTNVTGMVVIC